MQERDKWIDRGSKREIERDIKGGRDWEQENQREIKGTRVRGSKREK